MLRTPAECRRRRAPSDRGRRSRRAHSNDDVPVLSPGRTTRSEVKNVVGLSAGSRSTFAPRADRRARLAGVVATVAHAALAARTGRVGVAGDVDAALQGGGEGRAIGGSSWILPHMSVRKALTMQRAADPTRRAAPAGRSSSWRVSVQAPGTLLQSSSNSQVPLPSMPGGAVDAAAARTGALGAVGADRCRRCRRAVTLRRQEVDADHVELRLGAVGQAQAGQEAGVEAADGEICRASRRCRPPPRPRTAPPAPDWPVRDQPHSRRALGRMVNGTCASGGNGRPPWQIAGNVGVARHRRA